MTDNMLDGGWYINHELVEGNTQISEESQSLFDEAVQGLDGAGYFPLLYCGGQVVAGQNHMFIARQTLVLQTPVHHVVQMIIYKPLNGKATITLIKRLL